MKAVLLIAVFGLVGFVVAANSQLERFDDFKVYKVDIQNDEQLKEFKKFGDNLPVHYLNDNGNAGKSYDVTIDPDNQNDFEERLRYYGFSFKVMFENLQKVLEERWWKKPKSAMEWTEYHGLDDIYSWVDGVARTYRRIVKSYVIGHSYEGRPIKALKISWKKGNKAIFIDSNIHAIEWISSAAGTCFINNLLTSKDRKMKYLLQNYDFIYVPVLNPDGFEYTHNVNPLWRKSRKPTGFSNSSGICYGTDLNRNFNYKWKVGGYNIDVPCDHWYGGSAPNSEPEVIALQAFISSFKDGYIKMYLTLHSYGNMVLLPYGHTKDEFPPNYNQMMTISQSFADAARVQYNTTFLCGASSVLLYPLSGASKDWVYAVKKIPYTATVELRDTGTYGFLLPANQILEVCAELTDGLVGMITAAEKENLFRG